MAIPEYGPVEGFDLQPNPDGSGIEKKPLLPVSWAAEHPVTHRDRVQVYQPADPDFYFKVILVE